MGGLRSATLWIIIFLAFILIYFHFSERKHPDQLNIIDFFQLAKEGRIVKAVDKGGDIEGIYRDEANAEKPFQTAYLADQGREVLVKMIEYNVKYDPKPQSPVFQQVLFSLLLPILLFLGLWYLIMRQIQGTGNKALSFGKSRAKLVSEDQVKLTFNDVAGVDEAKEELQEVVEFLKDPKRFSRLGGKIPKGVLLYGPPGTGKTLLAKAVAGEANVPFFSISGSDFVEMFVGVGASRVRDLFEQGKRSKPCLIFIDEIDAVGRQRFAGIGGGHDEREQTLNQLLVEMDGFNANEGVILIAATNRPDVLDPALLRPGRFDRQITIDFPDVKGREKILRVHARQVKLAKDVDFAILARATPGFSGADLANMINEAALLAARRSKDAVDQHELEEAKDRVMMGPERRSLALTENEKVGTAYHEIGHALCAKFLPDADPVHKVTIIPRGRALGVTSILPGEERHTQTERKLRSYLVYMMGGRAAEETMLKEFTTGAGNDLQKATELAHRMVCDFGMSKRLGPRTFGDPGGQIFLGKDIARERNFSEATAKIIDEEVKELLEDAYQRALQILRDNKDALERIAVKLIERETLSGDELDLLIRGEELPPIFKDGKPVAEKAEKEQIAAPERNQKKAGSPLGTIDLPKPKEITP
jgi:cell division protease FtsH